MTENCSHAAPDRKVRVEVKIKPDFLEVRRALAEIRASLAPILDDDPMSTIEIVGAEILNNVVEHGFAGEIEDDKFIEVFAAFDGQKLILRIIDDGIPMPGGAVPEGKARDIDPKSISALPEGGFGWGLIHMLSGDLSYAYQDGKNRLQVSIDI